MTSLLTSPEPGSVEYVALHGSGQIKCGRRPVLSFRGITDPEEAFTAAVEVHNVQRLCRPNGYHGEPRIVEPHVYEFELPDHFTEVYVALSALAEAFIGQFVRRTRGDHKNATLTLEYEGQQVDIGGITLQVVIAGITVRINWRTSPAEITNEWRWAYLGLTNTTVVGPAHADITKQKRAEYEEAIEERKRAAAQKVHWATETRYDCANELHRKLNYFLDMELKSPRLWSVFRSLAGDEQYSLLSFAEQWARLMQNEMLHGVTINDAQDITFAEVYAAHEPFTPEQVAVVIDILRESWAHGDMLSETFNHPLINPPTTPKILMFE